MKLEIKNIAKSFGEKSVLKDMNFSVENGTALGLLGRNGAGKTTTIRIIMGVFNSNEGEVLLDGKKINYDKTNIGYLPEERGLYPKKKIMEQMIYFGKLRGMTKNDAKAEAEKWLKRLGMSEYTNKKLDTLSKGNQQKIQFATTLLSNPDIVILDEPFSGLDPVNAMLLKDVVKELIADNKIVIFSSHQMNYVEEFCDNIVILNKGNIVLDGNIKKIKRTYNRDKLVISTIYKEKIIAAIKNNLGNEIKDIKSDDNSVIVTLNNADYKNEFIKAVSDFEIDFDGINVYEPSLNDIFVEYTEDKDEKIQ